MEKEIEGWAGYSVTPKGQVYSFKWNSRKELKQSEHKGYRRVVLSQNNKRQTFPVHCLVARAFIPNPNSKPFVNHMDGNKHNNEVSNLQWCTAKENQRHAYDVLNIRNGKTGYTYAKLYPNEELRNRLVELGVPRYRHNLAELGEMLPGNINGDIFVTQKGMLGNLWYCTQRTHNLDSDGLTDEHQEEADTEADARAKMLIYLLENKLI